MRSLDFRGFHDALAALERSVAVVQTQTRLLELPDVLEVVRQGVIQAFEFTYEQAWKAMRRVLAYELGEAVVAGLARRELYRMAARQRLIEDVDRWMDLHDARNMTSHTYDHAIAEEVFQTAVSFVRDARSLAERLRAYESIA